jgi:hypothetical protein
MLIEYIMKSIPALIEFFIAIREDSRISPVHISLFMAIMQHWNEHDCKSPISVFSKDLMQLAKISGVATYHRTIKELHEYGYIKYQPSYNHFTGSLIFIKEIKNRISQTKL